MVQLWSLLGYTWLITVMQIIQGIAMVTRRHQVEIGSWRGYKNLNLKTPWEVLNFKKSNIHLWILPYSWSFFHWFTAVCVDVPTEVSDPDLQRWIPYMRPRAVHPGNLQELMKDYRSFKMKWCKSGGCFGEEMVDLGMLGLMMFSYLCWCPMWVEGREVCFKSWLFRTECFGGETQ